MNPTRREFVIGACAFAGMFAVGGTAWALGQDAAALRPPGGQDAAAFRALCVKCDRCRSACPTGCVVPASIEDGLLDARMPRLDFHRGYCDFCGKCIDACPTGALAAFDPARDKIGVAYLDPGKCIAYTRGQCFVCQGSCAYGALEFDESSRPVIHAQRCNGCGACVMACAVNANRAYDGTSTRAIEVHPLGGA